MGLIGTALAVVLTVDAGMPARDAGVGFEPVVLNVHHGVVFTELPDGGSSDAPTVIDGGTWLDDATTSWVAENKADWRAQAQVPPAIDTKTLTLVGGILFIIGVVTGGTLVYVYKK